MINKTFRFPPFFMLTKEKHFNLFIVVGQSLSHVRLCDPMNYSTLASLSFAISLSLLKLMSIESVMPSNHFIPCHLPSPLALSLSQHQSLFQTVTIKALYISILLSYLHINSLVRFDNYRFASISTMFFEKNYFYFTLFGILLPCLY